MTPANDTTPLRRLLPIYEAIDERMSRAAEEHGASCRKGCASCCEQLVGASSYEADAIADYILSNGKLGWSRALRRLSEQADMLEEIAQGNPKIFYAVEWWQRRVPCAFLDAATRTCRIYPVRPLACRTYFVNSDPALCGDRGQPGGAIVQRLESTVDRVFYDGMPEAMADTGVPPVLDVLQVAVWERLATKPGVVAA